MDLLNKIGLILLAVGTILGGIGFLFKSSGLINLSQYIGIIGVMIIVLWSLLIGLTI